MFYGQLHARSARDTRCLPYEQDAEGETGGVSPLL